MRKNYTEYYWYRMNKYILLILVLFVTSLSAFKVELVGDIKSKNNEKKILTPILSTIILKPFKTPILEAKVVNKIIQVYSPIIKKDK